MNEDQSGPYRPIRACLPYPGRGTGLLAAALALALLAGCATSGHPMDNWVGVRLSDYLRLNGQQAEPGPAAADSRGNLVYVVDASQGAGCTTNLVVDRVGFIQGWTSRGSSCR